MTRLWLQWKRANGLLDRPQAVESEPYQEVPDELKLARRRSSTSASSIVFLFGILTVQLARIQLVNGEKYQLRAETNRLREVPLIPQRGLIFDRNGLPLVENRADVRRRRRRRRPAGRARETEITHRAAGDHRRPGRRDRRQDRSAPQLQRPVLADRRSRTTCRRT